MMKRALITGGTGFVGANLARHLLAQGHRVHLLVRRGYQPWRIAEIRDRIDLVEVHLTDRRGLLRAIKAIRPDWVFHLATYGAYPTQNDLQEMLRTNIHGTINLVEACVKVGFEAFINTGSSSEYGYKDHAPPETEWLDPNSHYALTKAFATHYCRYTATSQRLRLTTLRLYSVFGPYEEPTRLIPTLITHGMRGELPALVNPAIARDFVYVDDVNNAYCLAAEGAEAGEGAVYNVGTGTQLTLHAAVEVARQEFGIGAEPRWGTMPDRQWDTNMWVADSHQIRAALGWYPTVSFAEGFRRTVDWYRTHQEGSPALR
jgi:nucleoside-diphosphate-sugar epimerase